MNKKAKLLFDECIGWPILEQLAGVIGFNEEEVEVAHAVKMGFGGKNDEDWIPQIASDGWVIITGDDGRQKKKGKGEKLPILCAALGVTYAAFSKSICHYKSFQKYRVILAVWDDLIALKDVEPGSGFSIRPSSSGHPHVVLKRPAVQPTKTQKNLPNTE